jgi:hypothetical protein
VKTDPCTVLHEEVFETKKTSFEMLGFRPGYIETIRNCHSWPVGKAVGGNVLGLPESFLIKESLRWPAKKSPAVE